MEKVLGSKVKVKTYQELGITPEQWINLAESLLLSRDFANLLPHSPLSAIHIMNVDRLEKMFGLREEVPEEKD